MAIVSYRDRDAEGLSATGTSRRYAAFARIALRKLRMLEAATSLQDLRSPPGNHLEALAGDRIGQHAIRINQQFRICFRWSEAGASDVEIVDYH
ncbi:MAG TPA: type II toxin-antitoxin system RelE/ParE family toxin [Oscillatoriaceae cyanobacterium]